MTPPGMVATTILRVPPELDQILRSNPKLKGQWLLVYSLPYRQHSAVKISHKKSLNQVGFVASGKRFRSRGLEVFLYGTDGIVIVAPISCPLVRDATWSKPLTC